MGSLFKLLQLLSSVLHKPWVSWKGTTFFYKHSTKIQGRTCQTDKIFGFLLFIGSSLARIPKVECGWSLTDWTAKIQTTSGSYLVLLPPLLISCEKCAHLLRKSVKRFHSAFQINQDFNNKGKQEDSNENESNWNVFSGRSYHREKYRFLRFCPKALICLSRKGKYQWKDNQNRAVYADEWCLGHSKNATEFFTREV